MPSVHEAYEMLAALSDKQLIAAGTLARQAFSLRGFGKDHARMSKADKLEYVAGLAVSLTADKLAEVIRQVTEGAAGREQARNQAEPSANAPNAPEESGDGDGSADAEDAADENADEAEGDAQDDPATADGADEADAPEGMPEPQAADAPTPEETAGAAQQAGPMLEQVIRTLARDEAAKADAVLAESTVKALAWVARNATGGGQAIGGGVPTGGQAIGGGASMPARGGELLHPAVPKVLSLLTLPADLRPNVLLVGPAGSGKTHLARQVARLLGIEFGCLSLSGGVTESALLGRALPGDGGRFAYYPAPFARAYEHGGLFLCDEVDAADPNVLLVVNAALANGHLTIEQRAVAGLPVEVARHESNAILCAANTDGSGATMQYTGRSRLDAAFLDRFVVLGMGYDPAIEAAIMGLPIPSAKAWAPTQRSTAQVAAELRAAHAWIMQARAALAQAQSERMLSTRAMQKAKALIVAGWSRAEVADTLCFGWSADEKAPLTKALDAYVMGAK